jgi:hypothetical protein
MLALPGKLDGRSLGTRSCDPRTARAAWLSSSALAFKFKLVKDHYLGGDEPDCETDYQRAQRECS